MDVSNYGSTLPYNKHRMLELNNPTSICDKRWGNLLYITNFDDIMGYSQVYSIIINDDCSRLSHVWLTAQFLAIFEENEWPRRIEYRFCIYLFNDLAQYFVCILLLYHLFIACYMKIVEFYTIFFTQLLIMSYITYFYCWCICVAYWLRTRAIYSVMPTL